MEQDEKNKKHLSNGNNNNDDQSDIVAWFEGVSEKAGSVQAQTLRRILELNWGVEYLNKWFGSDIQIQHLDDSELESLYKSLVPLSSHADIEASLQRIADGDTAPILTQQLITTLSLRAYPIKEGGRILEFIYSSREFKTKGGVGVGTATTHYYNSQEFKIKQEKTKSFTCSPQQVISSGDYKQSTYCHLLLGLFFSHQVEFITSTFAYSVVQAFASFEELWRDLCADLRHGTLNLTRVQTQSPREAVLEIISPSPELASRVEEMCEELEGLDWRGMIPRLWPNAKYVYSIMTGSMQPYMKKLRHYANGLPLVSADYGSTESWIGANLDPLSPPENVSFAVVPTFSYFEFIPLYRNGNNKNNLAIKNSDDFIENEPISLSQVEIGQEYEIVLTTFTGLYRYRLGDVVEVAGFHNSTPKLNFVCRRKLILTVNIDKNTEKDLQMVVERGSELLMSQARAELVDFTSHADVSSPPVGHYIIYWEIKGNADERVLQECCTKMDASFVDHGYVVSRRTNSIGPLELRIVERGSFKKVLECFIANGAALSQFKTPRCTSNNVILKILDLCTVETFHSTAYDC